MTWPPRPRDTKHVGYLGYFSMRSLFASFLRVVVLNSVVLGRRPDAAFQLPKKQSSSHWSRSFIARTQPRDGGRGLFWNRLILQFVSRCMVAKKTRFRPDLPHSPPFHACNHPLH